MLQRKYMQKNRSIARTVSIEAVLQPRFYYAVSYFSFDAEVLFAFFAFGDTFFTLGLMVHIGLGSDRRRRRNSEKISSKSEHKSVKRIQK